MKSVLGEPIVESAVKSPPYLWKRPTNGVYYVVFYDGPLAKRKRMESLKTRDKRTAEDRLYLWKRQKAREEELGVRHVGIPLEDAKKEYLRHFERRNKATSVRRYGTALDNVLDFVGRELPIGNLRAKDLQDYQLHRIVRARPRTVDSELTMLRAFLNWCRRRNWVNENVADSDHIECLVNRKTKGEKKRVFTDEELALLLSPNEMLYWQYFVVFSLLYYTGIRIGEASFLTVKDVDLRQRELHIREKEIKVPIWDRNSKRNTVRSVHWTPKWYEGRVVPIESRLEPILRQFREARTDNIFGLYFCTERGNQISDHIGRQIKQLIGKDDVAAHTFRYTHVSHALNRWGRHPSVVQKWVGHRDLKTTMQYIRVSVDDLHREAQKTGP